MSDFTTHTITFTATFTTRGDVPTRVVEERVANAIWDTGDYDLLVEDVHAAHDLESLALVELAGILNVVRQYSSQGIQIAERYINEDGAQ